MYPFELEFAHRSQRNLNILWANIARRKQFVYNGQKEVLAGRITHEIRGPVAV